MSLNHGSKIVTSGLVLMLDAANIKSFRGEPTTNYIYDQNSRLDTSYSAVDLSSYGGTMVANHPGVIQTYDLNGNAFNAVYYNGGVGDPTNSQHAYWIYDGVIKKPVVQMIDKNGSWQAKYMGLNMIAWSTYGYGVGTKYTISWMQWVTHLDKRANVGMYTRNSLDSYNFWDGLSSASSTSTNTKTNTWEKVYHTYTVTSNWDQTKPVSGIYFYGHSWGFYTLRIADVQLEIKGHPTQFLNGLTRGATVATGGGWNDLSGKVNHGELVNGPTFDTGNNGSIVLLSDDYIIAGNSGMNHRTGNFTYCAWINQTSLGSYNTLFENGLYTGGILIRPTTGSVVEIYSQGSSPGSFTYTPSINTWYYLSFVRNGSFLNFYINGIYSSQIAFTADVQPSTNYLYIGASQHAPTQVFNGKISITQVYNRALSPSELLQNFNATKGRYGL